MNWIDWLEHHLLSCPFKSLTGIDCPGCGMQRSVIALLRGHIGESLRMYPALILVIITLSLTVLHVKRRYKNGAKLIKLSYIITISLVMISYITKLIVTYV
ncbi:MAG: DUF2752 domain-containing protein [Pseudopedobacter saltans]|uniref:DUF2752 domain-containing protein n=1 Tax=Pseudopedobacter saltans TaxID=151895 RepID=A0A2W5GV80_9SPHI|nr:MAG: DUF2752 domain-containing protein [Pseudopedobacter saltans]